MIRHIIFWTLSDAGRARDQRALLAELRASLAGMDGKIDGLLRAEIGPNTAGGCDYVFYAELRDEAALAAYQTHPLHMAHKARFADVFSERRVGDYNTGA